MLEDHTKTVAILVAIVAGCCGFFLGAIAIGLALSGKASDAVLNLIGNLLTFVGAGAAAYIGFRQLNVGVSQIAESVRQSTFDRTMQFVSTIEAKYRAIDLGSWRKCIDDFDFLLPIEKLPKTRVNEFISSAQQLKEYKEVVELLNLASEAFNGIELGVYNERYVVERSFRFFSDIWRISWPLIAMERERDKIMFPGTIPAYMLDLENFLRKHDAIFVPIPTIVQA